MSTVEGMPYLIDKEDYARVKDLCWRVHNGKTKKTYYITVKVGRDSVMLHRYLLGVEKGVQVDHKNRRGFDNRKENLRTATRFENAKNRNKVTCILGKPVRSKYKGVARAKHDKKWRAYIWAEGKQQNLGLYENEIAAALAYDTASEKYHGEFGKKNFPNGSKGELKAA
jgi:hypothetical protein